MPFSQNETQHLIYLLNCEYRKKRELREKMLSNIYKSFKYPKVLNLEQELDHLKDELVANQLLVHKLDDHLTDLRRGNTLETIEDLEEEERSFLGSEASRHLKLLTTKPQDETD